MVYNQPMMELTAQQRMELDEELLIRVNSADTNLGSIGKATAHSGAGTLHRAFTIFLRNQTGEWLLAQRSEHKPLWPLWWDAACSSHPWFPDESVEKAALRRVPFELGIAPDQLLAITNLGAYEYHAVYSPQWSENEVNHTLLATVANSNQLQLNPREVATTRWAATAEVDAQLVGEHQFAPWFAQAWALARDN